MQCPNLPDGCTDEMIERAWGMTNDCPKCGEQMGSAKHCQRCGQCPECGYVAFCPECEKYQRAAARDHEGRL